MEKMRFKCCWAATLLVLSSLNPLQAQFTFTKVADFSTPIPNGTGNFSNFDIPASYGTNIAFWGGGTNSQKGFYLWSGGILTRIADLTTAIPGGGGNFTSFSGYDVSVNASGTALFRAQGAASQGIYKYAGTTLSRVVDTSFAIPGGPGNFTGLFSANESGGLSAFIGKDSNSVFGIYTYNGSAVVNLVNTNTTLPGTSDKFAFTDYVINDHGSLAFTISKSPNNSQAVYSYTSGALHLIADTNTVVPGAAVKFKSFISPPNIAGNTVSFVGLFGNPIVMGIFSANADGTGLTRLVDTTMTAPGVTNRFTAFYGGFADLNGTLIFSANLTALTGMGTYSLVGGNLANVLAPGDPLGGKTVKSANLGNADLAGGTVVIGVTFTDNSNAIYSTPIAIANSAPSFTSQTNIIGGFQMNLSLTAGKAYRLQGTTNLVDTNAWVTVTNIASAPAALQFLDTAATNLPFRFYRIISP